MRGRVVAASLAFPIVLLVGATIGCGGGEQPFRIGLLVDCVGVFRTLDTAELSGAELPLLERGSRLKRTDDPTQGVTAARVAGRPVQLLPACTETLEYSTMFQEARRLVELEHVDAVVGGAFGEDGVAMRDVARLYPSVVFMVAPHGPREVTLRARPPNLFRVSADHGQLVAGLASYAYRRLGWRRAAVVSEDWDSGWGSAAAFVAEFCSLGGQVVEQKRAASPEQVAVDAPQLARSSDGVAVLTTGTFGSQATLVRHLVSSLGDPARRLVLGPSVLADDATIRGIPSLTGVVGAAISPPPAASPSAKVYEESYVRAFGRSEVAAAHNGLTLTYRNAVEAVLQALERARGDTTRVGSELAGLRAVLVGVPVHVDRNGQAVVSSTIVRIGPPADGGDRPVELLHQIPDVDQSIGGLLAPGLRPASADQPCRRSPPPPWARS
jgi:branched-chain amino acid transport system substrate-binding protein